MYIIGAKNEAALEAILELYDHAQTEEQRDQAVRQAYDLVGDAIRAMVHRAAGKQRVDPTQVDALAWQALYQGMAQTGMSRFKRSDAQHGDWTPIIARMLRTRGSGADPIARRLWSLISETTKAAVSANPIYMKSTVQDAFLRDLNALLRRRDLLDAATWYGLELGEEGRALLAKGPAHLSQTEISRFNALAVSAAFPEINHPSKPTRNLMGLISATIIPKMRPQIFESASGRRYDQYLQEMMSFLRPDIEAVQQLEAQGAMPEEWHPLSRAERIYQHQRQRLSSRYGSILSWWNEQIRQLLPQSAFTIRDGVSLKQAREYLEQNKDRIPEQGWKFRDSPYYLPTVAVQPYGVRAIERLLATEALHARTDVQPTTRPAPGIATQPDDLRVETLLSGGHASAAFRWLIERLYSRPGYEVELSVGRYLAAHPAPSGQEVEQYLTSQPEQIADFIQENGWNRTVNEIDQAVVQALRSRAVQQELAQALNLPPQAVHAAIERIRRTAFCRTAAILRSA